MESISYMVCYEAKLKLISEWKIRQEMMTTGKKGTVNGS